MGTVLLHVKVMAREQALRLEKQNEQNAKDAILERMSADMAKRQKEQDEMENLRNGLPNLSHCACLSCNEDGRMPPQLTPFGSA